MRFDDFALAPSILRAVHDTGYTTATPIQAQAIPIALEGRDVLGCAQTGTGKTAAFALPILQHLGGSPQKGAGGGEVRCLVLAPTRELATQIADSFKTYGKHLSLKTAVIFGGVGQNPQVAALRRGVDVLVATPGRLLDLINQGHAKLSAVRHFVLDEADRMLDMGFIRDIQKIAAKLPEQRQTMLFSATMPREIRELCASLLRDPATVEVAPQSTTADRIEQGVYFVPKAAKSTLLGTMINGTSMSRAIVFTRTKHGADKLVRHLRTHNVQSEAIHGNKSQNARQRALDRFRTGKLHVLIATDVASRGIDVDGISHVVNYDVPRDPESYVHRIGRTARAGAAGIAVTFCDHEELPHLADIERLIRMPIPARTDQADLCDPRIEAARLAPRQAPAKASGGPRHGQSQNNGGRPRRGGGRGGAGGNAGGSAGSRRSRSGGGPRPAGDAASGGGRPRSRRRPQRSGGPRGSR